MPRTTAQLRALVSPPKQIRPRNPARQAETFARCFHSVERVEFVKSLPCIVRTNGGCSPEMENMHIEGEGMSRRAHYTKIVPACTIHHHEAHRGVKSFARKYGLDLAALAAETHKRWEAHCAETA